MVVDVSAVVLMAHRSEPPQTTVASCAYAPTVIAVDAAASQEIAFIVVSVEGSHDAVNDRTRLGDLPSSLSNPGLTCSR